MRIRRRLATQATVDEDDAVLRRRESKLFNIRATHRVENDPRALSSGNALNFRDEVRLVRGYHVRRTLLLQGGDLIALASGGNRYGASPVRQLDRCQADT